MSLTDLTAVELLRDLVSGRLSSVELTTAYLDRIQRHDGAVRAFLRVQPEAALDRARDIDRRRQAGEQLGRLAGLFSPGAVDLPVADQGRRRPQTFRAELHGDTEHLRPDHRRRLEPRAAVRVK